MSTTYELLRGLEIHEHSCKFDLALSAKAESKTITKLRRLFEDVPAAYSPGDEVVIPVVEDLSQEDLLRVIVKLIHIASYFDGEDQDTLARFNVDYNQVT